MMLYKSYYMAYAVRIEQNKSVLDLVFIMIGRNTLINFNVKSQEKQILYYLKEVVNHKPHKCKSLNLKCQMLQIAK